MLVAIAVALCLSEGLLRLRYPTLPSLAPLEEAELQVRAFDWSDYPPMKDRRDTSTTCREQSYLVPKGEIQERRYGSGEGAALKLWVAGDSVTMGYGVPPERAFGALLGQRLAEASGLPVVVRNLGINGAGFCAILRRLNENARANGAPDVVVLTLFADDLEDRALVGVSTRLVALPDRVEGPVARALVSESYLANLLWYGLLAQRMEASEARRFIDPGGQALFKDSIRYAHQRLEADGAAVVTALLAPAGLHLCEESPPEGSRCAWLGPDMDLMAEMLRAEGVSFVDLRHLWEGKPTMVLPRELERMQQGLELGIHPDEAGHQVLADALWPAVEGALLSRDLR